MANQNLYRVRYHFEKNNLRVGADPPFALVAATANDNATILAELGGVPGNLPSGTVIVIDSVSNESAGVALT